MPEPMASQPHARLSAAEPRACHAEPHRRRGIPCPRKHRIVTATPRLDRRPPRILDAMDTQFRLVTPLDTPSPTVTAAERLASEIAEAIDAIAARIPQLEA